MGLKTQKVKFSMLTSGQRPIDVQYMYTAARNWCGKNVSILINYFKYRLEEKKKSPVPTEISIRASVTI